MRFSHFRRYRRPVPAADNRDAERFPDQPDPGVAGEVEALLAGRLVGHMMAARRPPPAWAVLNRLAHGERSDLVQLVEDELIAGGTVHPSSGQPFWAAAERVVARHLLTLAPTPNDLRRIQQASLVPLELRLIDRCKAERFTAGQVLDLAAEAVDRFHEHR